MSPELHDALVDLVVRRLDIQLTGAPLVEWGIHALEEGVETESLIYLAGLSPDSSISQAGPLFDRGLAGLKLKLPHSDDLRRAYVGASSFAGWKAEAAGGAGPGAPESGKSAGPSIRSDALVLRLGGTGSHGL
jgi:hypothetical protein